MNEDTKSKMNTMVQLDKTMVPDVPFMWYREEQFYCPIAFLSKISEAKMRTIFKTNKPVGECFVLVQKNVLEKAYIYACFHTYAYTKNFPTTDQIVRIPPNFYKNYNFTAGIFSIQDFNETKLQFDQHSFGEDKYTSGSVFIHDAAFSPPGVFRFKVNEELELNTFVVHSSCDELGIVSTCLVLLVNCLKEKDNDEFVKSVVKKVEKFLEE
jgi:hypothetical protein